MPVGRYDETRSWRRRRARCSATRPAPSGRTGDGGDRGGVEPAEPGEQQNLPLSRGKLLECPLEPGCQLTGLGALAGRVRRSDRRHARLFHRVQIRTPPMVHQEAARVVVLLAAVGRRGRARGAARRRQRDLRALCAHLKRVLSRVPGVGQVEVSEGAGRATATVTFDDSRTTVASPVEAITDAGYPPRVAR